jgi:hypothetical protein
MPAQARARTPVGFRARSHSSMARSSSATSNGVRLAARCPLEECEGEHAAGDCAASAWRRWWGLDGCDSVKGQAGAAGLEQTRVVRGGYQRVRDGVRCGTVAARRPGGVRHASFAVAQAIVPGRSGDAVRAAELFAQRDSRLASVSWVRTLYRRYAAEAALMDGGASRRRQDRSSQPDGARRLRHRNRPVAPAT